MQRHDLFQGTPEWAAHRAGCWNASDAPAMLGCSPYQTRTELLHQIHIGVAPEVDASTQRRFADGHRFEALARPLAEEIIGDDLAPLVGSTDAGLSRPLSASFDGLTMMGDTAFEHKTLNGDLRGCMRDQGSGYDLPKHYRVQMEQQLIVSGAERVLFMASEWTGDGALVEERHCWYASDPALRAEILAGWAQFERDLETYQPAATAAPAPVGRAPEALPALRIEVTGMVTASNLDAFKEHALAVFKGINRNLTTDADFADAEKTVKWCSDVEDRLKAAKQHALSQTESIDALFRAIDDISGEARAVRLELDKLVKAEKERRRGDIVASGVKALADHIAGLNARLGKPYMPQVPADFGGAVKGLKSLASMEDKVATELARAKIEANRVADQIELNLRHLREHAGEYKHLFPDTGAIVLKAPDDLQALVAARIAQHKADEEKRLEAERERIRAEEQERADREARERSAAEQRQRDEAEAAQRRQEQAAAAANTGAQAPAAPPAAANVVPMPTKAPAPASAPTMRVGDINRLIAPLSIDAAGLAALGFPHAATDKAAKLYHVEGFPAIVDALIAHLADVREQRQAA